MTDIPAPPPLHPPDTTSATTTVTTSTNGSKSRFTAIGVSLVGCVIIEGLIAGFCIWHPPVELGWTSVNEVQKGLGQLALILAGGLLGSSKPS